MGEWHLAFATPTLRPTASARTAPGQDTAQSVRGAPSASSIGIAKRHPHRRTKLRANRQRGRGRPPGRPRRAIVPSEHPSVLLRDGQPAGRIHARGPANVLPREAPSSMHEHGTRELGTVETRYGGGHPWFAGNPETVLRFGRERPGITFRLAGARHPMLHRSKARRQRSGGFRVP